MIGDMDGYDGKLGKIWGRGRAPGEGCWMVVTL